MKVAMTTLVSGMSVSYCLIISMYNDHTKCFPCSNLNIIEGKAFDLSVVLKISL